MDFTVKTEVFEGPLELLLSLIEKRKLLINDISLAAVADDFIEYLNRHPEFPVAQTAHFILVASTLLLIKSKSLLPTLMLTEEEEQSVHDLERRLKMYQLIKQKAPELARLFGERPLFAKDPVPPAPVFSPDGSVTLSNLHQAVRDVLANLPQPQRKLTQATVQKVISLEEMVEHLTTRIERAMRMSFKEFSAGSGDRKMVIVSFLAMLELVKQGIVRVEQDAAFSDIVMEHSTVGTPQYG